MATIDIFPLAINGINSPLNLLYKLFNNTTPPNLIYPLDLAANPNYGHAVQFQVYKSTYKSAEYAQSLISGQTKPTLAGVTTNMGTGYGNKMIATKESLAAISLYMPDSLTNSYTHDWSQISLKDTLGLGSFLASSIADYNAIGGKNAPDSAKGNFFNFWGKAGLGGAASAAAGNLGPLGPGPEFGTLLQNQMKMLPNPQLQMLYKGIELREFQFDFIFTPSSKKEAMAVESIIRTFEYYSVPRLLNGGSDQNTQFIEPPELFDIQFVFTGGTGLSGAVSNFFKNIGTNILSSQLYGAIFGSQQALSGGQKAKIFQIYHPCVLTGMSVDYGPNGWVSYDDGYPLQTTMTLQFKETDIVTKADIDQYKNADESLLNSMTNSTQIGTTEEEQALIRNPEGAGDY